MRTTLLRLAVAGATLISGAGVALAAPNADMRVQLQAPASVNISTATTYTVTVKNLGPNTAQNVRFTVEFPLTNTSPTVAILGTVSGFNTSKCSVVSHKLSCTVGQLKNNKSATLTYQYTAPVSTKTLTMKAVVTSDTADTVSGNNESSVVPNLVYPARPLTSANMLNSHCTGTNLTSYFECLLFPSSIATHNTTFNIDNTISFTEPGYTGTWSQNAAKTSLRFEYFEPTGSGSTKVAEFNGWAINGANCFDGMTNFFPTSTYVSPYRVCVQ